MAYLDAAKIAALLKTVGPASFRRAMLVLLPEINTAIQTDAAAGLDALPETAGVAEAEKLVQLGSDKEIDAMTVGALSLGAGAGTEVTATAAELNQLASTDLADEFAALEGMDTELGLLSGLTIAAATLNALTSNPGKRAINILRVAAAGEDGETVTIGDDTYELDTEDVENITEGNIRVDVSGGTTEKSQGTLTIGAQVTAGDTFTIGDKEFTFVPNGTANADGEVNVGADEAGSKANIVNAIEGDDGWNEASEWVTCAEAFDGDDLVLTAIVGGTVGDEIATTETFTSGENVFDAPTLGTTNAGVDPTAGEVSDALIAAINESATEDVTAVDIGANEVLLIADAVGVVALACTETLAGASNAWAAATMYGGAAPAAVKIVAQARVPNATEVALGNIHFMFDFTPSFAQAQVRVTADGSPKAWDGALTMTGGRISLDNSGGTDWADTDTVYVIAWA